jgi:hypothetical protein
MEEEEKIKEKEKKGRKPLSITYVFENEKYLNILFLLYYCMLFRKKQKKKFLKQALIKDQFALFGNTTKPFNSSYYWPTPPEYPTEILVDDHFKQRRIKQKVRNTDHRHRSKSQNKDNTEEQWSLEKVMVHRTAVTVYTIILQQKIRQCDLGFLDTKELNDFKGKKPEQFYYDNLFETEPQLTKYLGTLKSVTIMILGERIGILPLEDIEK